MSGNNGNGGNIFLYARVETIRVSVLLFFSFWGNFCAKLFLQTQNPPFCDVYRLFLPLCHAVSVRSLVLPIFVSNPSIVDTDSSILRCFSFSFVMFSKNKSVSVHFTIFSNCFVEPSFSSSSQFFDFPRNKLIFLEIGV